MDHYTVPEENLPMMMESLIQDFPFLADLGVDMIVSRFKEAFDYHPELGGYVFNPDQIRTWLDSLKQSLIANAVWDLVKEGKMEMFWDAEANDFVFTRKPCE